MKCNICGKVLKKEKGTSCNTCRILEFEKKYDEHIIDLIRVYGANSKETQSFIKSFKKRNDYFPTSSKVKYLEKIFTKH